MEDTKPFWASKTLWGAIITAYAMLATPLNLPMPVGGIEGLGDEIVSLFGLALTIYGRFSAKKTLAAS